MRQPRRRYRSQHGAPLRFGRADRDQQTVLFIDFAPLLVFALLPVAAPLIGVSVLAYFVVAGLAVAAVLLWLRRRTAKVAVTMDCEALHVQNVFRNYRIPIASVTKVVNRQSWVGGIYAFCFGIRTRQRLAAIPGRSVPLHALTGADRQAQELRVLLRLDTLHAGQVPREERHVDMFVRRFYGLRRGEWVAVALVAVGIVGVNKLVIHDTGNTWSSLTLVSFYAACSLYTDGAK